MMISERDVFARIERVVLGGGGAKGIVYPGAYCAMVETGLLSRVNVLAGVSAGAIAATLAATGLPMAAFRKALLTTNLVELMGNNVGSVFGNHAAGVCFMTKDGRPLEEFIRRHIIGAVRTSISTLENLEAIAREHPDFNRLLIKIHSEQPRINFSDLALLNRLFPDTFKQLIILAVKFPDGEPQVFNAALTPDVEIALACRASASIPVALEPVEIDVGGKKQKFVDGGFYDNLPTDYFDMDAFGAFTKNKKPLQTMVFTFGEGVDNQKNHVFQALYGERWDEVISEGLLAAIIDDATIVTRHFLKLEDELGIHEEEPPPLVRAVKHFLERQVELGKMATAKSHAIIMAMQEGIESILSQPEEHQQFWIPYRCEKNELARIALLGKLIKEKMRPVIYDSGLLERIKRDVLVGVLSGLKPNYTNTAQKEAGYQKLRTEYALRTVELRVGHIKTADFNEATKCARVMDTMGYLDTVNYITNHELHDKTTFNAEQFYIGLVSYFECIYQAVLYGADRAPEVDALSQEISSLRMQLSRLGKSNEAISRQIYHLLKDRVESRLDSIEAFALSRAVEFHQKTLSSSELLKETYAEGIKRKSKFSLLNVVGWLFFGGSTTPKPRYFDHTHADKVFNSLLTIKAFQDAYLQDLQTKMCLMH